MQIDNDNTNKTAAAARSPETPLTPAEALIVLSKAFDVVIVSGLKPRLYTLRTGPGSPSAGVAVGLPGVGFNEAEKRFFFIQQ